ncbi:MAG: 3'-5' exonuclease [Paracoccaceae bacterium]
MNKKLDDYVFNKYSLNNEIIIDFETTGLDQAFLDITQTAAVDLHSNASIDVKVTPSGFNLPSPIAMEVTGTSYTSLSQAPISQYENASILDKIVGNASVVMSWNSSFDQPVLRKALYKNGFYPYVDVLDEGTFICAMRIASLASNLTNEFIIPVKQGKFSHKLTDVYEANFKESFDAHDALADVLATKRIWKFLSEDPNARKVIAKKTELYQKQKRQELFKNPDGFFAYNFRHKSFTHYCGVGSYAGRILTVKTDRLPDDILTIENDLNSSKKPKWWGNVYETMRDPVFGTQAFPELGLAPKKNDSSFLQKVGRLMAESDFAQHSWPEKIYLEEKEFGFPHWSDTSNWETFHRLEDWKEKSLVNFNNDISKKIKSRILYTEARHLLDLKMVSSIEETLHRRWLSTERERWMTAKEAFFEMMRIDSSKHERLGFEEYRRYLNTIKNKEQLEA